MRHVRSVSMGGVLIVDGQPLQVMLLDQFKMPKGTHRLALPTPPI